MEFFMSRVSPEPTTGCWLWTGKVGGSQPYGVLPSAHGSGRGTYAHRAALEMFGRPNPGGLHACHKCDNPSCVNPDHLFWGTRKDNLGDAARKGRTAIGVRNGSARLTPDAVRKIRALKRDGQTDVRVAEEFGISRGLVSQIYRRLIWKSVEDAP